MQTESLWQLRDDHRELVDAEILRRMLPLAYKLAGRYRSANEPFDDLAQVATLGLLSAIERFDPSRGPRFVSFAIPTILGELKRHFRNTGWAVHVPRGAQELALRVDRAVARLTEQHGRAPQVDELARDLDLDLGDVLDALEVREAHYSSSLDAPVQPSDEDRVALGETLGCEEDGYDLVDAVSHLRDGLQRLPFLERRAVILRYQHDLKQSEIAEQMGCSQMQVSRLLGRARSRMQVNAA
jgi:RNA polymerase sigma-B factor